MRHKFVMISASLLLVIALVSGCLDTSEGSYDIENVENIDYSTPQTNSEAGITITVTYLPEINDATAFDIEVTAHTDYDDDFKKNSYLRDSSGKTYQPISYEGSSGHHAKGTLKFPRIDSKRFELVIQDVAGVKERTYTW
ncbi:MAG: hypothetical protein KAI86_18480 [Desulfobacterales bacterium]|nr:hypothetical protein [Desulfobacterales bacterium]